MTIDDITNWVIILVRLGVIGRFVFCMVKLIGADEEVFETVYGVGLRLSEIARLRVQDIDSKEMRLFVHHGKGGRDRFTLLSQRNLEVMREYWKQYRPNHPKTHR